MSNRTRSITIFLSVLLAVSAVFSSEAASQSPRDRLIGAMQAGQFKAAYEGFRTLALSERTPKRQVAEDFQYALNCMDKLGMTAELDAFREAVVAKHSEDWHVLWTAAVSIAGGSHVGYLVDGKFTRGEPPKADGTDPPKWKVVSTFERDRTRAMQWMVDAMPLARRDRDRPLIARYFMAFGQIILAGRMEVVDSEFVSSTGGWKLQSLTNLNSLPDYQPADESRSAFGPGTPVAPDGKPLFYAIPHGFHAATNDGERWRYCLKEARQYNRSLRDEVFFQTAGFFHIQFGVQTLAFYGPAFGRLLDSRTKGIDGNVLELDTLSEDETVARLAIGVERFRMPEAFNFIRLYQDIIKKSQPYYAGKALAQLAEIFENRRQYNRAAEYWKTLIDRRDGDVTPWVSRLKQIVGPWGRFEPTMSQPAGRRAEIRFSFRNGHSIRCEAHRIDIAALLADVETYLKSRPEKVDFAKTNLADIGHRLIDQNETKYLGEKVAAWSAEIRPRSGHFDKTIALKTPFSKPGVYLLKSSMVGGNTSAIVIWITDTAIVQKPLDGKQFFFVADADTGKPVAEAAVRFFGWRQKHTENHDYIVETDEFAAKTDQRGQLIVSNDKLPESFRWVVTAKTGKGRFALLGWETFPGRQSAPRYDEVKAFLMTDRPVYRPGETVRYKFWIRRASYAPQEEITAASEFSGKPFEVLINDPDGEEIAKTNLVADDFGGIEGNIELPDDAPIGIFHATVRRPSETQPTGEGTFAVVGDNGADFEVALEAPSRPIPLGRPLRFSISATYRGGAPVTRGTVEYSVYRQARGPFFPARKWDWLYGPGYWCLQDPAPWLFGWDVWGRSCPEVTCEEADSAFGATAPELVAQSEIPLADNGRVEVELPTALTAALYPDENQAYRIEARVTNQMRKTSAARKEVLVAREPFEAVVWVDRGFAESGDEIRVSVLTAAANGVPSSREGKLFVYRVNYDSAGNSTEELFNEWDLTTDALGNGMKTINADSPGQYRVAFEFLDPTYGRTVGGCVFSVVGEAEADNYRFGPLSIVPERSTYQPGQKANLLITAARRNSTVLLFTRPENGLYGPPRLISMKGKTAKVALQVEATDVPNFFVEALSLSDGTPHNHVRRIVVPPSERILDVALAPSAATYLPGEKATVRLSLRGVDGEPVEGTAVIAVFEKALTQIVATVNENIKAFFWKWTRRHVSRGTSNLQWVFYNLVPPDSRPMENLGVFGDSISDGTSGGAAKENRVSPEHMTAEGGLGTVNGQDISDAGFWFSTVRTKSDGTATVDFTTPETSSRWEVVSWGLASGTRVGQAEKTVLTRKDFLVSLQSPSYLVKSDRCSLSALLENFNSQPKESSLKLAITGNAIAMRGRAASRGSTVEPDESARVTWTLDAKRPGDASLKVTANTNGQSDIVEKQLLVHPDGIPIIEAKGGVVSGEESRAGVTLNVPEERRVSETTLTVRLTGDLGGTAAEAVPFLYESSYAGTGQTLEQFLPACGLQKVLEARGADIQSAEETSTKRPPSGLLGVIEEAGEKSNPVFDADRVADAAKRGISNLAEMQLDDGGWGWFFGWGAVSNPFDTATVVHGLNRAKALGFEVDTDRIERGIEWLGRYEEEQIKQIRNYGYTPHRQPWKPGADNVDAFVFSILAEQNKQSQDMTEFLQRDRANLTPFGLALYCHGLVTLKDKAKLQTVVRDLWGFLRTDESKRKVWLETPGDQRKNRWYGNHMATQAAFLQLLVRIDPNNPLLPKVARYLVSRRANGTYWNSTYDTARCVEALSDFLSVQEAPEPTETSAQIWISGRLRNTVKILAKDRFRSLEAWKLEGRTVPTGNVLVQVRKKGTGSVCFSGLLKTFSPEDSLPPSGDLVTISRSYYVLEPVGETDGSPSRFTRYKRRPFTESTNLVRGNLIEVELTVESKATLDKMVVSDFRPAGFTPVNIREGYTENDLGAFVEHRNDRTIYFTPRLSEGSRYTVSYRMRADSSGSFTALPATVSGIFSPDVKANSGIIRVQVLE